MVSYQEGTGKSGCFAVWKHPRGHVWNVVVSPASPEVRPEGREAFQTMQGNGPSCRDQEGSRGSDEVVPGTSVFLSIETGMSGKFLGLIKGAKYRFDPQEGKWDFS